MTHNQRPPRIVSNWPPARTLLSAALAVAALLLAACGEDEKEGGAETGASIEHVHGLGANPKDGALFIATHGGLFRSPEGSSGATPVGEERQDTMGFTVVGPDSFLGSGHPAPGEEGRPPNLGLIESTDGGQTWEDVSLSGEVDFHILRFAGGRVYGVDALTGQLLISDDKGSTWAERSPPPGLIDLAIDPRDSERMLASTENGLLLSDDDGERWRPLAREVGLLAWAKPQSLLLIDAGGSVKTSGNGGASWQQIGSIDSQPAAFAASGSSLYAAGIDGTVLESKDDGATWDVRSAQ